MSAAHNLELKVRIDAAGLAAARRSLLAAGISSLRLRQTDTYLRTNYGWPNPRQVVPQNREPSVELLDASAAAELMETAEMLNLRHTGPNVVAGPNAEVLLTHQVTLGEKERR